MTMPLKLIAAILVVVTLMSIGGPTRGAARVDDAPPLQDEDEIEESGQTEARRRALFSDGFDATGDLALWSGDTSLVIEDTSGYGGGFGARGQSNGVPAYAESRLGNPSTDAFFRVRFRINNQGYHPITLLRFRTVAGRPILALNVGPEGSLGYYVDVSNITVDGPQVVTLDEWHEVQVRVHIDGNASQVAVWLDEQPIDQLSRGLGLGEDTIGRIEIGDNTSGRTFDVLFDDVIVDTTYIESARDPDPVGGLLVVHALPDVAGLQFMLDGETYVTDELGVARIEVYEWTTDLRQRIEVPDAALGPESNGATASFWGWQGWGGPRDKLVQAYFDLNYPTTLLFQDGDKNPIDASQVTSITLRNSVGNTYLFTGEQLRSPQVLPGSRVVPSREGRQSEPFTYSVLEVIVGGSNVVNKSQQFFEAGEIREFRVKLLLFSVTITARDALFGGSTGTGVEVKFPDGHMEEYSFAKDQTVTLNSLPRGEYEVGVIGGGFAPPRPLTLSRDQTLELEAVTTLDMAVVLGVIASFGFGLLFAGRPGILTWPFRFLMRRRPANAMQEMR